MDFEELMSSFTTSALNRRDETGHERLSFDLGNVSRPQAVSLFEGCEQETNDKRIYLINPK